MAKPPRWLLRTIWFNVFTRLCWKGNESSNNWFQERVADIENYHPNYVHEDHWTRENESNKTIHNNKIRTWTQPTCYRIVFDMDLFNFNRVIRNYHRAYSISYLNCLHTFQVFKGFSISNSKKLRRWVICIIMTFLKAI